MKDKNAIIIFVLLTISLGLLFPGVTEPMIEYSSNIRAAAGPLVLVDTQVMNESRSIIGTFNELVGRERYLVAYLILLFSVIIPSVKTLMLMASVFMKDQGSKLVIRKIVNFISKWSMADVFVVAILLVILATDERGEKIYFSAMGFNVEILLMIKSNVLTGFYWFVGYCVFSISSLYFIKIADNE